MSCAKFNGFLCRVILFLAILAMLLPATVMLVGAEEAEAQPEIDDRRFAAEEMKAENAELVVNDDGTVTIKIKESSPAVSMKVLPVDFKTKANALRIVIKNDSLCNGMKIDYVYKNSAQISESASVAEQSVKPLSDATEYIVYVDSVDTMTHLSLRFSGASAGEITIASICAVSVFQDDREYYGTLFENSYDGKLHKAVFSGSVSYDMLLKYPNARVVLYRLAQTEVIEDVRFVHPYVDSCPMTLNYKFEFDIKSTSEYCSRYFAAILTEDNKILPLTSETYLKDNNGDGNNKVDGGSSVGFKGIETNLYAGAAENGTAVAFVDVRLDKLENESGNGYQYVLDHGKEYYFDRAYVMELDEQVKSLSSAGASVYFRFLLDSPSPIFGHFERYILSKETKYFAIDPQNDETVDNIFAYTDFICSRYAELTDGAFKGIVLGRSLDKAMKYNYAGSVSLNSYADMLARTYSIMRIALARTDGELEMIIPLSDDKIGAEVVLGTEAREADYPADILARSFLSSLRRYGSDFSSVRFMLESDGVPMLLSAASDSSNDMTADNCSDFIELVDKLSKQYVDLSSDIMFCWYPSHELSALELLNTYTFNYNFLACTKGVRCYIVSFFEMNEQSNEGEPKLQTEEYIFSTLKSTYKYIDTDNNSRVCSLTLDALGVLDWKEIISGYSTDKTVKRDFFEKDAIYSLPPKTKGSYKMWDFSTANGTGGWSASDGCDALSVYTREEIASRALIATMRAAAERSFGADFGSVVYHAPESLLMQDVSTVSFEILIPEGDHGDIFELKVSVGADGAVSESSCIVKAGEVTNIFADISELDYIKFIRIGIRDLEGTSESAVDMCINSISIHSNEHNDDELKNMVLSGEILDGSDDPENKKEENSKNIEGIITIIVILSVSLLVVALFWMGIYVSQRRQNG